MAVLDDLKIVLDPSISEDLLNLYIRKGVTLITNHLQLDTTTQTINNGDGTTTIVQPIDVASTYPDAIVEFVVENYNKRGNEGLKQFSQGSHSGAYDSALSADVKALLPKPYIRMRSTVIDSSAYNA